VECRYFEDEMRYGTRTEMGKRWLPKGERPVCPVKIGYDFGLLYLALCPYNGDIFAMFLPNMDVVCFDIFTQKLQEHVGQKIKLILDRAACHTAATQNEAVELIFLPPACPELNPAERFFKELRKELKIRVFQSIQSIEDKITKMLRKYWDNPKKVVSITSFPYLNTQ
jgi:hypothetical protein